MHPTLNSKAFWLMDRFLQEKRACGYAYHEPFRILHRLDDFLVQQGLETLELSRGLARNWLAKKPHESASTQQQRITIVRQFSKFLLTAGCPAYVPDSTVAARKSIFVPRMLTEEELRKFVTSFPGELIDEAHRSFHSCDQFP